MWSKELSRESNLEPSQFGGLNRTHYRLEHIIDFVRPEKVGNVADILKVTPEFTKIFDMVRSETEGYSFLQCNKVSLMQI